MDGALSSSADRVQRLLRPVSAEARGGADARLGDRFDRLQSEVAKLLRASSDGDIDWRMVVEQSEALLVGEAKDLRAAVYLAVAWHRLEGLTGLQRGLDLLSGLLVDYWDEVFPAKPPLRAEVLTWLTDRVRDLGPALVRADLEQVKATWSTFTRFRDVVRTRFPERGPTLGPIEQAFALLPADKRPPSDAAVPTPPPLLETATEDELLRPFRGEDPCGEDPRLTDEFEILRVEIAKVGAVAAQDAEWPKVAALSRKLLVERSKDLRCLAWLTIARHRTDGSTGLADAIAALAACAERFGDKLLPRRAKARTGALSWLGERLQAEVVRQPIVITADLLARARADLARAKQALEPLCEDTNGLSLADDALARVKPRGHTASQVTRPPNAPRPRPPTATSATAPAADAGMAELAETLLAAARARSAAGEDATTLRLRRLALWMTPPDAMPAKKHECDSGTPQQRAELAALASAENWPELLERCEIEIETTPFWFDLTYWSIKAGEHVLGKDAARTLKGELVALVMRHPALFNGFDRKGQWLASKEMRDWFSRELTPRPPSVEPVEKPAEPVKTEAPTKLVIVEPGDLPELPEDLQKALEAKKYDDAVAQASQWIAAANGRTRFARNVAFAQHCLKSGSPKLAFPMFRALEGQLRKATLPEWDPALTVLCIRGYLASKLAVGIAIGTQDERLVDELALLDPKAMTGLLR